MAGVTVGVGIVLDEEDEVWLVEPCELTDLVLWDELSGPVEAPETLPEASLVSWMRRSVSVKAIPTGTTRPGSTDLPMVSPPPWPR